MNQPERGDANACERRSVVEHLVILAATAFVTAAVLKAPPLQSANDRSRWATVWSLVERQTFQIDEIDAVGRWSTIDKVRYRRNETEPWHFYSSKPPLLSTIVAGLYAIERATLGYGLFNDTAVVTRLLLLVVNVLPFYLALRSLTACLKLLDTSLTVRVFVLIAAGFGTIANPYLTTLNNHTPAIVCAMFTVAAAIRIVCTTRCDSPQTISPDSADVASVRTLTAPLLKTADFVSLGFFAALTSCFELPAAQLGVLAFILAVRIDWRFTLRCFVPAALIPLAAFFITNWMATGGIKPFYATYGSETYIYEHNGIPSYWSNPRDLDANTEPVPVYLFHCVLGHHGLLSLTPVLFISLLGWWFSVMRNRTDQSAINARQTVILAGAIMSLITLSFYLSRTENYNYGGNSVGLRWMMWLSPFWWIAMVPALERMTSRSSRVAVNTCLLISVITVAWSMDRPWRPSWLYEQLESRGWIQYRTQPTPFEPGRPVVLSLIPKEFGRSFSWRSSDGQRLTLTVQPAKSPQQNLVSLVAHFEDASGSQVLETYLLDRDRFAAGRPLEEFLKSAESSASTAGHSNSLKLPDILRALPESRYFNAAGSIYISSRSDATKAWHVERGAARVYVEDPVLGPCWHRCDVQYCDQLPFGVLQWKTAVNSDTTGEVLNTQTWVAETH